ncbi:MAG: hypothetical protein IJ060_01420 [Oscillospiraceae bacterium]|nr:hypothetical protein [Oscillospiraceae bacterium]
MKREDGAAYAAGLLRRKHAALLSGGEDRLPHRSDFTAEEVVLIKAHLGPFPRALEAAGLKPPRDDGYAERRLQKRIAAKRRRTRAKLARQKSETKP